MLLAPRRRAVAPPLGPRRRTSGRSPAGGVVAVGPAGARGRACAAGGRPPLGGGPGPTTIPPRSIRPDRPDRLATGLRAVLSFRLLDAGRVLVSAQSPREAADREPVVRIVPAIRPSPSG